MRPGHCLFLLIGLSLPPAPAREVRLVMGTLAEIRLSGPVDPSPALDAAFAELDLVDQQMSLWKDSELRRLNQRGRARCSPALLAVLRHALEVAADSGGAFDPTVEPLVRLAGHLGDAPRRPRPGERESLRSRVCWKRVRLDARRGLVSLAGGARLDLGGIAKGYAVDRALMALEAAGAKEALVDLGGSSIAGFGAEITLDVRNPDGAALPPWGSFVLTQGAVGTSGADQRPGHIFDPRTGLPAARATGATVVASNAMEADALSTALYVLGADEGLALLERRGAAGFVLLRENGRPLIRTTPGFAAAFRLVPAPGVDVR
jgi:thiamine biosynthesis lipoprotein